MGDTAPEDWLGQNGFDPIQCPHCDEVTTPNLLADGSYVCSCTAERALPLETAHGTPWDGDPVTMPAPMDDASFVSSGGQEHAVPPGERGTAAEEGKRAKSRTLPAGKGQFGRDISTEEYEPLNDAAAGVKSAIPRTMRSLSLQALRSLLGTRETGCVRLQAPGAGTLR